MRERHFVLGLAPLPAPTEASHRWDNTYKEWRAALQRLLSDLEKPPVSAFVSLRHGNEYRRAPVHANGDEVVRFRSRAYAAPPWLEVAIVIVGSPAVAAACYKLLKAWIDARAGRQIRLKFGSWQADFKGFSERKVAKLFRLLATIAAEESKGAEAPFAHSVEAFLTERFVKQEGLTASTVNQVQPETAGAKARSKRSRRVVKKKRRTV
ncbi:MAG: hypothetical protein HYS14_04410 [Candidatus Rokubacteria bacterium]|nr:hypothetical protein [Candidatus Rokubacteria bacterium]